ncbi:hypothetical protein R6Q59_017661 [Mikania micrantha]
MLQFTLLNEKPKLISKTGIVHLKFSDQENNTKWVLNRLQETQMTTKSRTRSRSSVRGGPMAACGAAVGG